MWNCHISFLTRTLLPAEFSLCKVLQFKLFNSEWPRTSTRPTGSDSLIWLMRHSWNTLPLHPSLRPPPNSCLDPHSCHKHHDSVISWLLATNPVTFLPRQISHPFWIITNHPIWWGFFLAACQPEEEKAATSLRRRPEAGEGVPSSISHSGRAAGG